MKLTDYIADFLYLHGIRHVFGLTGGAVVHLFDSVDRHPNMKAVFNHHEQASAFAAEAYAKINGFGTCFTTTGPGATNAITGLAAAWLDSVPCLYISGQTRFSHTTADKKIRQLGTQQIHIIPIVESITKYAIMLDDPKKIRYHLQKAIHLARSGRPGPVWIDIPLDFQWAEIEPSELEEFHPEELIASSSKIENMNKLDQCKEWLMQAKRPLILAGYGIHLANAQNEFKEFIETYQIPYITSWSAADLLPSDFGMNIGRPGIAGQRGSNLAIQNCDFLLCIGSHLCIPLTGTIYESFAREAKVVMIDIDQDELDHKTVHVELPIQMDAKVFLTDIVKNKLNVNFNNIAAWVEKCSEYRKLNQIPQEWKIQKNRVNQYFFIDTVSNLLDKEDMIVIDGGGTNVYITYQAFKLKSPQRLILSTGLCSMGSGLPEAIGVCFANNQKRTICFCGDGSLQLNIQELQTIVHHQLPIKIFVFNNDGYNSIRQTQKIFLNQNYCGSEAQGGMSLPEFTKIAQAYGLETYKIEDHENLTSNIQKVLDKPTPTLCEVLVPRDLEIVPTQGFIENPDGTFRPRPLEDMAPLLEREKFDQLMIVKPWNK